MSNYLVSNVEKLRVDQFSVVINVVIFHLYVLLGSLFLSSLIHNIACLFCILTESF